MIRAALLVLTIWMVGACGFQPVYGNRHGAAADGLLTISEIRGRDGYMLRRALELELAAGLPGLSEPATLSIELDNDLVRLAFQPDGAASRSSIVARGRYRLQGASVDVSGLLDAEATFAVPDAPFGDISAQTYASDRAMRVLAKRIADDLRLKLAAR